MFCANLRTKVDEVRANSLEESGSRSVTPGLGENAEIECDVVEEIGQSKIKRIPRRKADALNRCLCGQVLNSLTVGVLKCKQVGCETQWVSLFALKFIK
jgi:hypothetical protein